MGILLRPLSQDALERATRGMLTLTTSEYLVLRALLDGQKANGIASLTGLTKLTVQFYLKTIFRKCGCDRLALVRMAPNWNAILKSLVISPRSPAADRARVRCGWRWGHCKLQVNRRGRG